MIFRFRVIPVSLSTKKLNEKIPLAMERSGWMNVKNINTQAYKKPLSATVSIGTFE